MRLAVAAVACLVAVAAAAQAQSPGLPVIAVGSAPAQVAEVVRGADGGTLIRTEAGRWLRPRVSYGHVTLLPAEPPPEPAAPPDDLLPHSTVATGGRGGIARAWLAEPTPRYRHAALGDALEGGALTVEDRDGTRQTVRLPEAEVFEDLTPRLVDMDGDGADEVLVVRSHRDLGASVVVYGLDGEGRLVEKGATPPLGLPQRWLNPVGAADIDGDGAVEVVVVETPHGGGSLQVWEWRDGGFLRGPSVGNVSNHAMRSRLLGLHAMTDVDGDGLPDVVVPDQGRKDLRIFSFATGRPREIATVPLAGAVATEILPIPRGLLLGTTLGDLVAVTW